MLVSTLRRGRTSIARKCEQLNYSTRYTCLSHVPRSKNAMLLLNDNVGKIRMMCNGKDIKDSKTESVKSDVEINKQDPHKSEVHTFSDSQVHNDLNFKPKKEATTPETIGHAASNLTHTVQHNIASTLQFTQQRYEDFEKNVMQGIHEKNQRRFRIKLLATVLFLAWVTAVFGSEMRKYFTEQTAGLAKETLENESLKIQTQELATAVVQTILEDKEITNHAATFLKEASTAPETQQALLKLTLHILQHQETLDELTKLSQKLIKNLANDKVSYFLVLRLSSCLYRSILILALLIILSDHILPTPHIYTTRIATLHTQQNLHHRRRSARRRNCSRWYCRTLI